MVKGHFLNHSDTHSTLVGVVWGSTPEISAILWHFHVRFSGKVSFVAQLDEEYLGVWEAVFKIWNLMQDYNH